MMHHDHIHIGPGQSGMTQVDRLANIERWTLNGRIIEDYDPGDFTLDWSVTGPKPEHDGVEVEVVRADRGAEGALRELVDALDDIASPESEQRLERAVVAARALVHPGGQ